jgi:uncharacterized protein HemX
MKTAITIIILLIIGAGAYYFIDSNKVSENETNIQDDQNQQEDETPTTSQGKINIDEVCEGALIRMTFENGEAAAKFVEECKEGKHPEIIEQFKADMNLGVGAEV